jgi:nicotinamidase-related amidase
MTDLSADRQLREHYRLPGSVPDVGLIPGATALVVVDMQYLDAHRSGEFGRRAREYEIVDKVDWFFNRLEQVTVPAIQQLLDAARSTRLPVLHTRIASLTGDGRDLGWRYQHWGMTAGVDDQDSQFVPGLEPLPGEVVLNKTTTSAFIGSHIDTILRHLGVQSLVICGVMTSGCVESTVRDAADSGYHVLIPEEGCAALTQRAHEYSLEAMDPVFARIKPCETIVKQVKDLAG